MKFKSAQWNTIIARKELAAVMKVLGFKKGGNLIDIGCSTGDFLDVASKHFSVQGIYFS